MNFNKQLIIISRVREEKKEDEGKRGLCVITSIVFLDDTEQFLRWVSGEPTKSHALLFQQRGAGAASPQNDQLHQHRSQTVETTKRCLAEAETAQTF